MIGGNGEVQCSSSCSHRIVYRPVGRRAVYARNGSPLGEVSRVTTLFTFLLIAWCSQELYTWAGSLELAYFTWTFAKKGGLAASKNQKQNDPVGSIDMYFSAARSTMYGKGGTTPTHDHR